MCFVSVNISSFTIEKYPETLHSRSNEEFITNGIRLILNNISFQFDNKNYNQTLGTAMGTKKHPKFNTLTKKYILNHKEKLQKYKNRIY